jgi:Tfp pilus assembly protein PilV
MTGVYFSNGRRDMSNVRESRVILKTRTARRVDESGASLILALIFLVVVSVTVLSLSTWTTNSLNDVAQFRAPAAVRSAVDGAVEVAVQDERYNVTPTSITNVAATPSVVCDTVTVPENSAPQLFSIWCDTVQDLANTNGNTRVVTFDACSGSPATLCSSPLLVAKVSYDDYAFPVGQVLTTYCKSDCGKSMTITSWVDSMS